MSFIEAEIPKAKGTYIQAKLRRGNTETIAWIESKGMKIGDEVEIKGTEEFWRVEALYGSISAEALMQKKEMDRLFGPSLRRKK